VRIYLANRFGSFSPNLLFQQADSVGNIYQQMQQSLGRLSEIYAQEPESFAGHGLIAEASAALQQWYDRFAQVRAINESDQWRADSFHMENNFIPLLDDIKSSLNQVSSQLRAGEHAATEELKRNGKLQVLILGAIIALFLVFIGTILVSMEIMVLRPISQVVSALRSRAFGSETQQMLRARSRETQFLVDAFQEMDYEVNKRQRALEYQALHDVLTTLPNRAMLGEHLNYQILASRRFDCPLALLVLDLDRFKEVNDSLGHGVGDQLLVEVAQCFRRTIRDTDTIARLGGDEFSVLLPTAGREMAGELALALCQSIAKPFEIEGNQIHVETSIGIAIFPDDGNDGETLMRHADVAMYNAKRNRTGFEFYDLARDEYGEKRVSLISSLRRALQSGQQLELRFQPQVELLSGNVSGAEALLRWRHPEFGQIQPENIVDLAEHVGLINELSLWIIERALGECANWRKSGKQLSVSVNLSVRNLTYEGLAGCIGDLLDKYCLQPDVLTLEITESAMMTNPGRSMAVLQSLHDMGVKLAIDDFGTGFSSLAYLKKLPVDEIKIDKSFVLDMETDTNDAMIVQSTIDLGHNLGLRVVAEGIESEALKAQLRALRCDAGQGYHFSRPLTASAFRTWLKQDGLAA